MTQKFQATSRGAVAAVIAASALGLGYLWGGGAPTSADANAKAPAAAMEHANGLSEAFRFASDRVMPAVVTIQHTGETKTVKMNGDRNPLKGKNGQIPDQFRDLPPQFRKFFEDMPEMEGMREMPSRPSQSQGSGVIIDRSGLVLTNNHVVAGGGKVMVKLEDGREFEATEVKTDPSTDLAIVRIKADGDLPVAKLGNSDDVRVGDWVLALGQPFGLANTVTAGIISAKGRGIGITDHEEFLQTDAAINPGNSGGPLVNLQGEIVGINTAISSTSGGYQGIGFAVPVNVAKWVTQQLDKDGKVHRAYLGVGIQPVTSELAAQLGMKTPRGAMVTEVRSGSPAEKAGVKVGDVIKTFAGSAVHDTRQLSALVARTSVEGKQPLVVIRDGKETTLQVAVQEMPSDFKVVRRDANTEESNEPEATSVKKLGVEVSPLTSENAEQLGLKAKEGVLITGVDDNSPAAKAGLEAGMLIERVGQTSIHTVAELEAAMNSASLERGLMVLVRTSEGSRFVVVKG